MTVAIVGAGVSGLACAERLRAAGIDCVLFDKGRRPGGRLSTLEVDGMAWDFGAQYIRPVSADFAQQVAAWRSAGLVAPWPDGPSGALVGVPRMSSLIDAQCAAHDVRFGAQIQRIMRDTQGWHLSGPGLAEGPFAALIVTVPAEQAATLLSLHDFHMAQEAAAVRSQPCWTVMVGFAEPLDGVPPVFVDHGAIAWAARNNSKPDRGPAECWVIQATADWSQQHLESDREAVADRLLTHFAVAGARTLPQPRFLKAHRWRFALPFGQGGAVLWNGNLRLGAAGDWCAAPHIEGAWRSGVDLADQLITALTGDDAVAPITAR